jgi:hypothetical protein
LGIIVRQAGSRGGEASQHIRRFQTGEIDQLGGNPALVDLDAVAGLSRWSDAMRKVACHAGTIGDPRPQIIDSCQAREVCTVYITRQAGAPVEQQIYGPRSRDRSHGNKVNGRGTVGVADGRRRAIPSPDGLCRRVQLRGCKHALAHVLVAVRSASTSARFRVQ